MNFIYPIGFVALAGLIIPVIIHLWSIKQGKTLKIGSISLLGESASASAKSLSLSDWPLFILRCLLLILLAFLLAQPYFQQTEKSKKQAGWILLEQPEFKTVYHTYRKTIDSLLTLGFELRRFNVGFEKIELADTLSSYQPRNVSYSALLKQLSGTLPNNYQAVVFANRQLKNFDSDLPKVGFKLIWNTIKSVDTTKSWTTDFAGKSYTATSNPSFTVYKAVANAQKPIISVLLHYSNANDRKYISSAILAIADFTNRKIVITDWKNGEKQQADVGFWLSAQKIDPDFESKLKKDANLFSYQQGKISTNLSTLILNSAASDYAAIALHQRIIAASSKGSAVWKDGFGNPILTLEKGEKLNYFRCYTQLNPQWNDLVWSDQFVQALLPILIGDGKSTNFGFEDHQLDQRILSAQQSETIHYNTTTETPVVKTIKPLDQLFWIIALLVLLAERWLSFKKNKAAYVKG